MLTKSTDFTLRKARYLLVNCLFTALHGDMLRLRFHPLVEGIGILQRG